MSAFLRKALSALAAVFVLALATDAHATHFRYGTLRWEKVSEDANTVTLKVTHESAWRRSYPSYPGGTNNDGVRDIAFFTRTAFVLRLTYVVE